MALVFSLQNESNIVFILPFKRSSFVARKMSLVGSMSKSSPPMEQTLCSCLLKNITSKNIKKLETDCAYVKYAVNYSTK